MILFSGETFNNENSLKTKINLKFSFEGKYLRNSSIITKLFKKNEILPQVSRYLTKVKLWSNNNLHIQKE